MEGRLEKKFICIEGVNATGKTEVCQALARILGYKYYKTPSAPFLEVRDRFEAVSCKSRYFFYRSALQHASEEIANILPHHGVVCERYIHSTQIAHSIEDPSVEIYFSENQLLQPDITIIITASEQIRANRLQKRANLRKFEVDLGHQRTAASRFLSLGFRAVDNSERSVEEVCRDIIKIAFAER